MKFDFTDNPEAIDLLSILEYSTDNLFLTGKAGTGKTTLLQHIQQCTKKRFISLAPTGAAALNISGSTIHSFFQFPFMPILPEDAVNYEYKLEKQELLRQIELIIIDEVSMVSADLIDAIDRNLKYYRKSSAPFGGIQLLLVGDSFQLPPILKEKEWTILKQFYPSLFFFDALIFKSTKLITIELLKTYRQHEQLFLEILGAIRINSINQDILNRLNQRVVVPKNGQEVVTLATTNETVNVINNERLNQITSPLFEYYGLKNGNFPDKSIENPIRLKVGAQVMMTKNNHSRGWVNGSLGIISHLSNESIIVRLNEGGEVAVEKETWENLDYKYDSGAKKINFKVIGTYTQFPLMLSWAMTIHKSQGKTFNQLQINLGKGSWLSGQTYVALSRCRTLNGLYLTQPITKKDVILDEQILAFSNNFNNEDVYRSSYKAKKSNKESLQTEIEKKKQDFDYKTIISLLHQILTLPNNLIEKFYHLSLLGYCQFRVGQTNEGEETVKDLEKYFTLKNSIGLLAYDSVMTILRGAAELNDKDPRRGAHRLHNITTLNTPEVQEILNAIVFDRVTFDQFISLSL